MDWDEVMAVVLGLLIALAIYTPFGIMFAALAAWVVS